jgi:hypothetical protein
LHRVVNSHAGRYRTARTVDIKLDVFFWILVLKMQELSDHDIGQTIADWAAQKYDPLFKQTGVNIITTLPVRSFFYDCRD